MLKEVFKKVKIQEGIEVEEYLFEFSSNLMHALSLLWSKNKRTYTPEFCRFMAQKCVKNMIQAFLSVEYNESQISKALEYYVEENLKMIEEFDTDYIILGLGIEFTGGSSQTDIVLKLGVLLAVIESKLGITVAEVLKGEFDF